MPVKLRFMVRELRAEGLDMEESVVDADGHVLEPMTLWERFLGRRHREHAPRVVRNDWGLDTVYVGSQEIVTAPLGLLGTPGSRMNEAAELHRSTRELGFTPRRLRYAAEMRRKPNEYFARQCWVAFEGDEDTLPALLPHVGEERVVWGSDYPHHDATFPGAVRKLRSLLDPLSEGARRRVLGANACALYRLPVPPQ